MKFTMRVAYTHDLSDAWDEHENRSEITTVAEARAWAVRTLKNFNDTLRPGELAQTLLGVTFDNPTNKEEARHSWRKVNLVTLITPRLGCYDILQCEACGITAKRYGLTNIVIDGHWRSRRYKPCTPEAKHGTRSLQQ